MSDATFNPYHQWLGLERSVTRPNHYQLLGVAPTEQNAQRIAEAASRVLAKVRSCQPGPRGAEWAQLVEQVTAATSCLCDPVRRAEYDRQLGVSAGAGRSLNRPAPRSRVVPAAGGASAVLPMHAPQGGPAVRLPRPAVGGGYVDPMAPVAPAGAAGVASAYGQVAGYGTPQAPAARGYPGVGTPLPAVPVANGYGYPAAGQGHIPAGVPIAAVPANRATSVATAPIVERTRTTASRVRRRTKSSNLVLLAVGTGVVMLLLAGVILGIVLSGQVDNRNRSGSRPVVRATPIVADRTASPEAVRKPAPPSPPAQTTEPQPTDLAPQTDNRGDSSDAVTPDDVLSNLPPPSESPSPAPSESLTGPASSPPDRKRPWPDQPAEMPAANSSSDAELTLPAFPPAPTLDPLNKTVPQPTSPEAKPSSQGESEPLQPAETSPGPGDVKPEEVEALAKTLEAAHAAVLDRKYDAAIDELGKVATLPKLPEHHAKYERLMLLAGYAKNFQSALQSAIAGLQAGDEIEVGGSTVVGFVSAAQRSITLRVTGTNRTYALENLPVGMAVALADRWLDKDDPVSLAVKGAYLASLKETNDERKARARQWLEEASQKGIEGELHKVLDDSYDLEAAP